MRITYENECKMPSIVPGTRQAPRKWSYEKKDQVQHLCALGWGSSDLSSLDPDFKCLKRVRISVTSNGLSAVLLGG